MNDSARRITVDQWDRRYAELRSRGLCEPDYGGPLGRHVADGDRRLLRLRLDDSPAALRLWNFLLTETEIIGLLASGTLPEDIVKGVQAAIASQVAAMAGRHLVVPVIFTGEVAMVPGMEAAMEAALGQPVVVPPSPNSPAR